LSVRIALGTPDSRKNALKHGKSHIGPCGLEAFTRQQIARTARTVIADGQRVAVVPQHELALQYEAALLTNLFTESGEIRTTLPKSR
jgi:hypothetical protein